MSPRALLAETLKLNARASRRGSGATDRGRYQIIARLTPAKSWLAHYQLCRHETV
jgi:hypothetical protein